MYRFRNTKDNSLTFLPVKPEGYTVGRKDCLIKIEGDQSISRKHAVLTVTHPLENIGHPERLPTIELKDNSKYGTLVNGKKTKTGDVIILKDGDVISFGAMNSNSWRVEYKPFVAACSGVSGADKQRLKKMVADLGGHLVSEWTKDCTLLVMKEVNVTAKVIGSLISCRHIVTPDYVEKYLMAVKENLSNLPDVTSFFPPVVERAINQDKSLFILKEERRNILKGKTFVFLSEKQHKRLHSVISLAGGAAELYLQGRCSQSLLQDSNTCVMQSEVSDHTQTPGSVTKEVEDILKRKNLRMIAEAELGLAVLTVSTSVYCNPLVAKEGVKLINCMKESQFVNPATQRVLVADTPSSETPGNKNDGPQPESHHLQRTSSKNGTLKQTEIKLEQPLPSSSADRQQKQEVSVKKEPLLSKNLVPDTPASVTSTLPSEAVDSSRKNMKRPLPSDEAAPQSSTETSGDGQSWKKAMVESIDDTIPVAKIKQEPGDPGGTGPSDMPSSVPGQSETVKRKPAEGRLAIQDAEIDTSTGERQSDVQEMEGSQSQLVDSEGSQSQWRQKKRRRRLMSEDDEEENKEVQSEKRSKVEEKDESKMSEVLQPLPGFISKDNPPLDCVKEEKLTDESELPRHLVIVKTASLVVQKPALSNMFKANGTSDRNVKNFKKFKKSRYAGQSILPKIIGGSDLAVHHSMPSQASQEMFRQNGQKNSDIDKAEALADELFSVEPKVRRMR